MPRLFRACALALLVCAACDAGSEPRVGSPGLEPPHGTDDGGLGEDSNPGGLPAGGRGANAGGSGSSGTPGAGMSGGAGAVSTGGSSASSAGAGGAGGAGGVLDPTMSADAGVDADAGVPFSELHEAEILKDCSESVQCYRQRDEQLTDPDPIMACVEDSAAALDGDPARQQLFLANVERCAAFIVCDYYDCATSQP